MKNFKSITLLFALACCSAFVAAQTVDEVFSKYLDAMGGKERISKVTSLYTESSADIMGMQTVQKVTTLNGKGYKQVMDIGGTVITTCFNDKEGWIINPYVGSSTAETMPESDYTSGRGQIYVGGLYSVYKKEGYQAEVLGKEKIGDADAVKVEITPPGGVSGLYFFDKNTGHLIQTRMETEAQGMMIETVVDFSDFREVDGITIPFNTHVNSGGMMELDLVVTKAEVDIEVDPAIFIKP